MITKLTEQKGCIIAEFIDSDSPQTHLIFLVY